MVFLAKLSLNDTIDYLIFKIAFESHTMYDRTYCSCCVNDRHTVNKGVTIENERNKLKRYLTNQAIIKSEFIIDFLLIHVHALQLFWVNKII